MADIYGIARGLKCREMDGECEEVLCSDCDYWRKFDFGNCCMLGNLMHDAREEIEKRIPVTPIFRDGKTYCGACGVRIPGKIKAKYCHKCGQAVKWSADD